MEYIVQENETIADIAQKTGADPQEIIFLNYLDESTPIQAGDFLEVPGEAGRMKMNRFQGGGEVEQVQTKKPSPGPSLPIMGKSAIPDSGMKQKNFIQNAPKPSVGKMPAGAMQGQKKSAKNIRSMFSQGGGKKMMRPQGGIASMERPPSPGGPPAGPTPGQQAQPQQPSGGAGGQWLNSFIQKRRFAAGGGVPTVSPAGDWRDQPGNFVSQEHYEAWLRNFTGYGDDRYVNYPLDVGGPAPAGSSDSTSKMMRRFLENPENLRGMALPEVASPQQGPAYGEPAGTDPAREQGVPRSRDFTLLGGREARGGLFPGFSGSRGHFTSVMPWEDMTPDERERYLSLGGAPPDSGVDQMGEEGSAAPQSSFSDVYQRTLQNLRSGGLRGAGQEAGAQPAQQFFGGGSIPLPQSQQPQAPGLGEFQSRQQSLEPINPYPQGQLGQGPLNQTAEGLASLGRGGDSMLMHVNKDEVNQMATSINPETGLPEAFVWAAIPAIMSVVSAVGGIVGQVAGGGKEEGGGMLQPSGNSQKAPFSPAPDPRDSQSAGTRPGEQMQQPAPGGIVGAPEIPVPKSIAPAAPSSYQSQAPAPQTPPTQQNGAGLTSIPEVFRRGEKRNFNRGMKFREGGLALLDRNIPRHPRDDFRY